MFPFLQQKAADPSAEAEAEAGAQQPPWELLPRQVLWGEQAALPAAALIAVTRGASSSLGGQRVTGTGVAGLVGGALRQSRPLGDLGPMVVLGQGLCLWDACQVGCLMAQARRLAQVGWNLGTIPASHVALARIPLISSPQAAVRRDQDGWLRLVVTMQPWLLPDSVLLPYVACSLWQCPQGWGEHGVLCHLPTLPGAGLPGHKAVGAQGLLGRPRAQQVHELDV